MGDRGEKKRVFFDATGILRWGAQPPTGIQRVEQEICRYCLARPDIGILAFDVYAGGYRPLRRASSGYLDFILREETAAEAGKPSRAFRHLGAQLFFQDNEMARRLAAALAGGGERSGRRYRLAKTAVRLLCWIAALVFLAGGLARRAGAVFRRKRDDSGPGPIAPLLVSHEVARHPALASSLGASGLTPVFVIHDIIPIEHPDVVSKRFHRGMEQLMRRILADNERVITLSEAVKADIVRWNRDVARCDYRREIRTCRLNATIQGAARPDRPVEALAGRSFAVFCSTMDLRKRHDVLLSAWSRIAGRVGVDRLPDLVFIGRKGSASEAIAATLAAMPEIAPRVHCLHGLDDAQLRWAYRNAVIGLFPSSLEGWGLGVSECLAHGLPVMHADLPPLREAAQNLMPSAPVGDVEAWTDLLAGLFEQPDRIEALRRTVRDGYDAGTPSGFAECITRQLFEFAGPRPASQDA